MIFLGRILQVDDRDEYYKTAIGVETGYTTDVYIIRISHNKIERRPAINDQVVFTGVEGRSVDKSIFALESIKIYRIFKLFRMWIPYDFPNMHDMT